MDMKPDASAAYQKGTCHGRFLNLGFAPLAHLESFMQAASMVQIPAATLAESAWHRARVRLERSARVWQISRRGSGGSLGGGLGLSWALRYPPVFHRNCMDASLRNRRLRRTQPSLDSIGSHNSPGGGDFVGECVCHTGASQAAAARACASRHTSAVWRAQ